MTKLELVASTSTLDDLQREVLRAAAEGRHADHDALVRQLAALRARAANLQTVPSGVDRLLPE
jgi:hypothetical protein